MDGVKREKWIEADIDALPAGEHDYFERKSGRLFDRTDNLLGALAKALSAFANSGGGHLILGVDDTGTPDGVPSTVGRTPVRDWLEQKIPHLVEYPLSDFRVHVAERSTPSHIAVGRDVIVIDVGDSGLAPHQCAYGGGEARKHVYYYRQAGRSEPAPHFYLELLRQRLVSPVLETKVVKVLPEKIKRIEDGLFLAMRLRFLIENVGRVAAYKWQLQVREMGGHVKERIQDYRVGSANFPPGMSFNSSIRLDDTILPGGVMDEDVQFGIVLRPMAETLEALSVELDSLLSSLMFRYRIATEASPGELRDLELRHVLEVHEFASFVVAHLGEHSQRGMIPSLSRLR